MKTFSRKLLTSAAALSLICSQAQSLLPLAVAANTAGTVQIQSESESTTVQAERTAAIADGREYIIAGGNASLDQILSAQLTSGSKVSSVFKALSLSGLDLSNASQAIEGQSEWVWIARLSEDGKIALQHKASGKYMSMTEGQRPIALVDEPVYVNLLEAAHTKGGRAFALNLGTWYMNYSETQFGFSFYNGTNYGQDETSAVNQLAFFEVKQAAQPDPEEPEVPVDQDASANLLFLSDFQTGNEVAPYTSKDDVPEVLRSVIRGIGTTMTEAGFTEIDNALYCGDYSAFSGQYNYDADPTYGIQALDEEVNALWGNDHERVLIQGNHDLTNYPYNSGAYEYDDYTVYAINTMYNGDTEGCFPWYQGSSSTNRTRVERLAGRLDAYLDAKEESQDNRPVIIMSHVPLHFSGRVSSLYGAGDNMNAKLLFDVINEHGASQDIVFLFGHNHSNGWDSYLGGSAVFRQPGDQIAIPDSDRKSGSTTNYYITEELTFTYMNAGYVGYWKDGTADNTLSASMCQIYPDRLVFRRYSKDGLHTLGSIGNYNNKYADQGILGDFEIVKDEVASPAAVLRNTGEPALSVQMETAFAGKETTLNALSKNMHNPVFDWTISDPAAFEVIESGKDLRLFCKKAGEYTITLHAYDDQDHELTREFTLMVAADASEAAAILKDGSGAASGRFDAQDQPVLSLSFAGISEVRSVKWNLPSFVKAEGSGFARTLHFTASGTGEITVEADVLDASSNPVTVTASYQAEAVVQPHYVRSELNEQGGSYLLVSKSGTALTSASRTASGVSVLDPSAVLSGISLGKTDDEIKGEYTGLVWQLIPAASGKWNLRHVQSGKYLTLTSSSRNTTLSDTPCDLEIAAGSASAGGQCIAIHAGSMYLNFSSSKAGFCGYSGAGISDANNQFVLYEYQQPEAPAPEDGADLSLLNLAVQYARNIELPETLHPSVRTFFTTALSEAEAILANGSDDQNAVDAAWSKLCQAIHMLGFTSDKSALLALIEQAEAIDLAGYEEQGKDAFHAALEAAKETANNPDALDDSIAAAIEALENAMAALVPVSEEIDTTLLDLLVSLTEGTDLDQYIPDGQEAFITALAHAKDVLADPQSQQRVDEALQALHEAYLNLRLAPTEEMLRELQEFAAYLAALNLDGFDAALKADIASYQDEVNELLSDANAVRETAQVLIERKADLARRIEAAGKTNTNAPAASSSKPAGTAQSSASVKTACGSQALLSGLAGIGAASLMAVMLKRRRK